MDDEERKEEEAEKDHLKVGATDGPSLVGGDGSKPKKNRKTATLMANEATETPTDGGLESAAEPGGEPEPAYVAEISEEQRRRDEAHERHREYGLRRTEQHAAPGPLLDTEHQVVNRDNTNEDNADAGTLAVPGKSSSKDSLPGGANYKVPDESAQVLREKLLEKLESAYCVSVVSPANKTSDNQLDASSQAIKEILLEYEAALHHEARKNANDKGSKMLRIEGDHTEQRGSKDNSIDGESASASPGGSRGSRRTQHNARRTHASAMPDGGLDFGRAIPNNASGDNIKGGASTDLVIVTDAQGAQYQVESRNLLQGSKWKGLGDKARKWNQQDAPE